MLAEVAPDVIALQEAKYDPAAGPCWFGLPEVAANNLWSWADPTTTVVAPIPDDWERVDVWEPTSLYRDHLLYRASVLTVTGAGIMRLDDADDLCLLNGFWFPRFITWATFETAAAEPLAIYVVHLCSDGPDGIPDGSVSRAAHLSELLASMAADGIPSIALGDFNRDALDAELEPMWQAGMVDAFLAWPGGSTNPLTGTLNGYVSTLELLYERSLAERIDLIVHEQSVATGLSLVDTRAIPFGQTFTYPSDHWSVWADVELVPEPGGIGFLAGITLLAILHRRRALIPRNGGRR